MIELDLPAGSLDCAIAAFDNGADAVYLGLQHFSARKHAANFSFEDVRYLRAYAPNKNIYVTVNTIVDDDEILKVMSALRQLTYLHIDGVIVQDLGIARLVHKHFANVPLHGSTQMAVHSPNGVRMMQNLGFSRVVLSRELTIKEIAAIREQCPDVELKVFIHGAHCYGFSGLCMASQLLTSRSANRGECAQVCRTWFNLEPNMKSGYFFSMSDLSAGPVVRRLQDIGIDSLKIEGRMKSPEYVASATRYYRMLIDGETNEAILEHARLNLQTAFSRESHGGWLASYGRLNDEPRNGPKLSTVSYAGHKGIRVGNVKDVFVSSGNQIALVDLDKPISVRDGLMLLKKSISGIEEPIRFALTSMWSTTRTRLFDSTGHTTVYIKIPSETVVEAKSIVYKISAHDQNVSISRKVASTLYKLPVDLTIRIEQSKIELSTSMHEFFALEKAITYVESIEPEAAKRAQSTYENFREIFSSSGESLFTLGDLTIDNQTDIPIESMFLPLSKMKALRRTWYELLDESCRRWFDSVIQYDVEEYTPVGEKLPNRDRLNPPDANGTFIWINPKNITKALMCGQQIESFAAVYEDIVYLPLSPVMFDESGYLQALDTLIAHLADRTVRVGLNNIAQVLWARKHPEIQCFADIYLYIANRYAAELLLESMPNLIGAYHWIEKPYEGLKPWPLVVSDAGPSFRAPLFISRNCFRYDSLGKSCEGCTRKGQWEVEQTGKRFRVEVRDCITVVSMI